VFHHIVLFTFDDSLPDGHIDTLIVELTRYAATLEGLVSYDCGPDAGLSEGACDFGIVAVFEDEAAWHAYDTAAEHNRIRAELFRPWVSTRHVIQIRR
jgi:hypothetical protein